MKSDLTSEMHTLLDDERQILLSGRLDEVATIAERKQALVDRLRENNLAETVDLSGFRQAARQNQALLEASLSGLRSARARLGEIRKAARQLDTYTDGGERKNLLEGARKIERRA